ncbi:hypothetical protein V5O48_013951 [Marasmius crinis-equi]|uniref:Uncharacterized protein n=1 Tax=Marasmius crinis-equi TaxID=585013 RepID=A0ABR3EYN6_9AGAR
MRTKAAGTLDRLCGHGLFCPLCVFTGADSRFALAHSGTPNPGKMVYFLRSRVASASSIAAQQAPISPLFPAVSHAFDFASQATFLELRLVEKSNPVKTGPSVEDLFGDGEELTELSDSDSDEVGVDPPSIPVQEPPNPPPSTSSAPPLLGTKRPAGDNGQSYRNRKRRCVRKAAAVPASTALADPTPGPSKRAIQEALRPSKPRGVDLQAKDFDTAYGAHTGKMGKEKLGTQAEREAVYEVKDLVEGRGFDHIEWDGVTPIPIVDSKDTIASVLAGRPNRKEYLEDTKLAHGALMFEGTQAGLTGNCKKRGFFPAHTKGITMGMGSKLPVLLVPDNQRKGMGAILQRLVDLVVFKRISGYQNAAFRLWAPRLYEHYRDTADTVRCNLRTRHLPWNFGSGNAFAAAAFNFGGRVRTFKHRDHLNWAFGWCAITALGNFDPKQSARLILWEFKLVIDFPAGSTVLIPSAVVTHSNTRIAEGDERTSFTQYTAGAIFRWVGNGCMTEGELESSDPEAWSEMVNCKRSAVSERIKLYSTLDELLVYTE